MVTSSPHLQISELNEWSLFQDDEHRALAFLTEHRLMQNLHPHLHPCTTMATGESHLSTPTSESLKRVRSKKGICQFLSSSEHCVPHIRELSRTRLATKGSPPKDLFCTARVHNNRAGLDYGCDSLWFWADFVKARLQDLLVCIACKICVFGQAARILICC